MLTLLKLYCNKHKPLNKILSFILLFSMVAGLFTNSFALNIFADNGNMSAIKVKSVTNSPYFIQRLWLEPNTEYVFSYMYSGSPANDIMMKGTNEKEFAHSDREIDKNIKKIIRTFTVSDANDPEATVGTDSNVGKIQALVGIRLGSNNTDAIGSYYGGFTVYKKNDVTETNLFIDNNYESIGERDSGFTWNGLWNTNIKNNFTKVSLENNENFKRGYGVLSVSKGTQSYVGQWKKLNNNATYVTSFYYTPTVNPTHIKIAKNESKNDFFAINSIIYDESSLKATVEFTVKRDSVTVAYALSKGITLGTKEALAYVGIEFTATDNGCIYDWQLYKKSDQSKTNLFDDPTFTNLTAKANGGNWYNINGESPSNRFSVKGLMEVGGIEAFHSPDIGGSGEYVLVSNGKNDAYMTQEVSLEIGKNYYFSYYYRESTAKSYAIIKNRDAFAKGNIPIIGLTEDSEYYKVTVEFTVPEDADADAMKPGNAFLNLGIRATKNKTQYYYDFKVWAADDAEEKNLFVDGNFKYLGYKWKQKYWEESDIYSKTALSGIEGGINYFKLPTIEDFKKGDGTKYAIKTDGQKNPFFFQRVSLDPNKIYSFSFYHVNKISQEVYSGEARLFKQLRDKSNLPDDNIVSIIDDREWNKTTTTFMPFKLTDEDVMEDPDKPGNVLMYVGVRCWEEVMYYYGFELYDTDDPNQENMLLDLDFNYMGLTWIQMYWTEADRFMKIPVESLERGVEYFKKVRGPDIKVTEGPKMMSYGCNGSNGRLYIDLPYSVKKNVSNGKYYIVNISIRPTEGRPPAGFVTSSYNGGTTNVAPIKVNGYKYTFYLQERYKFRLGINFAKNTSGYVSNLEMYEADLNQNITGTKNLASFFGKDGCFSDWTIQSGLRWFDLDGGTVGTYPGELPEDYNGRITGRLVDMPEGYLVLENPGVWWKPEDAAEGTVTAVGSVSGTVKNSSHRSVSSAKIILSPMGEGARISAFTDKNGSFNFKNVPVGGYNLYLVEDDGNELLYSEDVWVESMGDAVSLKLTYDSKSTDIEKNVITTGTVKGYIVDKNGNPIKDLILLLDSEEITAITDENGYYEFKDVEVGLHNVMIKKENGKPLTIANIKVNEGVAYQLQTSDGQPIVYDKDAVVSSVKISPKPNHKSPDKNEDDNYYFLIIIAVIILIGGIGAFLIIKKCKQK